MLDGASTEINYQDVMEDIFNQDLVQWVWSKKYRFKDETSIDESLIRVCNAIMEDEPDEIKEICKQYMLDRSWNPGGRIHAGAGTGKNVTLNNCFVLQTIQDSMKSIMETLSHGAFAQQQGGGIGMDFSTLRPSGAYVKSIQAIASGPLPFMNMWNSMCKTIMSAGERRGAMMGVLAIWHPDIFKFIKSKHVKDVLTEFNISVTVTDKFMKALELDTEWDLIFNRPLPNENDHIDAYICDDPFHPFHGKKVYVYQRVKARDLWNKIISSTFEYSEPGIMFIDRINQLNNLNYCETISASNPCITGDTWIETSEGARRVTDLLGKKFIAKVNGQHWFSTDKGFFSSGVKDVLKIETKCGRVLRLTPEHKVLTRSLEQNVNNLTEAKTLQPGDHLVLHNHSQGKLTGLQNKDKPAYLLGYLMGNGHINSSSNDAILEMWNTPGTENIKSFMEEVMYTFSHRSDFVGWQSPINNPHQPSPYHLQRMKLAAFTKYAKNYNFIAGHKKITDGIEKESSSFCRYFLAGFFDADGTVLKYVKGKGGVNIRLSQSDYECLQVVQRMLGRLGINSVIYKNRRPEGKRLLPDGKGGEKEYDVKASHELSISKENNIRFMSIIPMLHSEKVKSVITSLEQYIKPIGREWFVAEVSDIKNDGKEEVFDAQVPGINFLDAGGVGILNCGEEILPPNGNCDLGCVNLTTIVKDPFTNYASIDYNKLKEVVKVGVRFLDNVLDKSNYPIPQMREESLNKRRIGLGITGLANMFMMLGVRYGSEDSVGITRKIMFNIALEAYKTSALLAGEKGSFLLYNEEEIIKAPFVKKLDSLCDGELIPLIKENGLRNGVLLTIAPTGTTSIYYGNLSGGLEPVFDLGEFTRNVRQQDGSFKPMKSQDFGMQLYHGLGHTEKQDWMVSALELTVEEHTKIQTACQEFVDASISKTINCPEDISYEEFKNVYMDAWRNGLKGCTTYKPSDVRGAILVSNSEEDKKKEKQLPAIISDKPIPRPDELTGKTYKIRWFDLPESFYITITNYENEDGSIIPFEIFINSKNIKSLEWVTAMTRLISSLFRKGGDIRFIVDELMQIHSPDGGMIYERQYIPSVVAHIALVIKKHFKSLGLYDDEMETSEVAVITEESDITTESETPTGQFTSGNDCPVCRMYTLIKREGCVECTNCTYSKCS